MIKIDEALLEELGLGAMPADDKQMFLSYLRQTLEMRVGQQLASGMPEDKLKEFERIISGDPAFVAEFLNTNRPGWQQDAAYQKQLEQAEKSNIPKQNVDTQFAALAWLEINHPNYKQVVEEELTKLKHEIKQQAPQILATPSNFDAGEQPAPQAQ